MDEFVRRFAALVHGTVRRVLGPNPPDPAVSLDDVAQDVFLKIFRNKADLLARFDPEKASLPTWIALIARSVAMDAGRKRRLKLVQLDEEAVQDPGSAVNREAESFEVPVNVLTGRQKLVLSLLFDRGWDVPRVAGFLNVDEQTVRSTKHKALERLREALSESSSGSKTR
jgi:RNA polymerase sigma-70 factor (ECF subfamily)